MDEINTDQPTVQEPIPIPGKQKPQKQSPEKPTTVDIKFTLTKKKKILLGLSTAIIVLLIALSAIWFTDLKYSVFGIFFKAEAQIVVADSETLQPIEGATVQIDSKSQKTDKMGKALLTNLTLGKKTLKITKEAYKNFEREEVIFIGLNKLEPVKLKGAGIPVSFLVVNTITKLPVKDASIAVGKNAVKTSGDGTAVINVLPKAKAVAIISNGGYNKQTFEFSVEENATPHTIKITPIGKNYFLSNRTGKIDLFESNLDGTNEKVLLKATGNEEEDTSISVSPNNKWVAMVSTREAVTGPSGSFVPILYLINPKDKTLTKVSSKVGISVVGWMGDNLIFSTDNQNYDEGQEVELISYNAFSQKKTTLIKTSAYLGSTVILGDRILFSQPDKSIQKYGLFIINPDGSNEKQIIKQAVYSIYKTAPSAFIFQSSDTNKWYSYNIDLGKLEQLKSKPPALKNKDFVLSPTKKRSAFVETRDGKSDVYIADAQGKKEKKLTNLGSITSPIRWIGDNYIIFRVSDNNEFGDYISGLAGGRPSKISDVYSNPANYGY